MMTREHHRRRSPESERRRRKERRSSREQVLGNLQHIPEPDRYQTTNTMRQEPSGSSHGYYESQPTAQRSSYYAPPPAPQSHHGQSRARSSSSNSSSSSTSSSLLNISRRSKTFGLKSFFTAASERHKRRVRKQRSRRMFRFGNGSSSSDLSDMAYGRGYIDRRKSRDFTPPGPHRRGETSDSGARPGPPKRAQTDEEIIELGRKFAEIARQQNKEDQRRAGRHKTPALLGAAAALSTYNKTSGSGRSERGVGSSKHSRHDSSDESEWESASEDESSSEDEDLVYGSAVNLPTGGHQSVHQSIHIHSPSSAGPQSEHDRMLQHKPSIVDPNRFGPVNSLRGYVNSPCGFDKVDRKTVSDSFQGHLPGQGSSSISQSETVLFEGRPMQNVYPVPTSDPNVYKTSRGSIVSLEQDSRGRPGPVPIQQPKPIVPVPSKVYDTTDADARYSKKSSSSGTALAGAAAAGLAGAAIANALSDRKDKEDRRDDRESRRERDSEKERDREREREEKRRLRRSDPKYAESHIGDDRDEKRRSKRSDDKYSYERDEKRKIRDDDRDLERAERRREKERLRDLEKEASKQTMDADQGHDRQNGRQVKDRDYQLEYGREYRGIERREDRKKDKERREDKSIASRSSDAESYRRIEDFNDPSARGPIDPFQFQVANDAFATPQRPLTPSIVTVDREPDFANSGGGYIRPMERLSRKDSYERELRNAGAIYDGTRTATAPIAAGAIAAATAAIGLERSRGRSRSRGGDESSRVREDHNDVVQDVANILYRRDVLARQAAEDRSRSASPDHSVVDKWKTEPESTKSGIITPPAKELSKPKSPYDGPDADVRIDRILQPEDLPLRPNGRPFKSRDPSAERERPMLNIVRPTPVPTPQPEWQQIQEEHREQAPEEKESRKDPKKKKKKNPPLVEQIRAASDVATSTRSEVTSTPSTPTSKGVTWGENETRRYVVESPERGHAEFSGARVVVPAEKPTPKSGKKSGWGILTSAITGAGAAAATSALSDSGRDQDAEETSSRVSTSSKRSRDRESPREKDVDRLETSSNISSSSRKSKDLDSPKEKDVDRFETFSNMSAGSRKSKDRDSTKDRDDVSSVISSSSRKSRDRASAEYDDRTRDDVKSNIYSSSRKSRDRDALQDGDDGASHVSSSSKKSRDSPKDKRSSFVPWDEAEEPPVPGPKPSNSRSSPMPGSFAEDLAFTATIAAGLQDSGFDPNIVIDDAKYHRRDSPPNPTGKPSLYESPFAETVTDLGKYPVEATGSNIGHDTGFILGEIPETPQEERDIPSDSVDLSKFNKKERKKLEKAAKKDSVDDYDDLKSQIVVQEEPDASQAAFEPIAREQDEWAPAEKLSKKEQKKRDKARAKALQEEESALSTPRDSEPETPQQVQDEDEWATSSKLSKKEKKKLEKAAKAKALQEDEVVEASVPQQSEPQATGPAFDEWEDSYSSKKSKKGKKNISLDWEESCGNFNDATESKISIPVDAFRDIQEEAQYAQPEDDWSVSSKKSKKSKRDFGAFDWASESVTPTAEDSQKGVQEEASFGQPEDTWSTSSKKSKKKSKRDSEIIESAIQTPLPAEETSRDMADESSIVQPEDDWFAPTSKKSKKKSKRNSEIYESPSQSVILPEPEVSRDTQSSIGAPFDDDWNISKKSKKKSKRDSGAYDSPSRSAAQSEVGESSYRTGEAENTPLPEDEWDTSKKSRKHSKQDSFATDNTDWTNVPSVVSESMHKSRSTDDFSIAEPAGGDDWEAPVKKSKKKSKRDSKSYDSPSQTAYEADDGAASPKAMTDSFADLRSDKSSGPLDDEWNESKKLKKSKRHSYHEPLPEPEYGSESTERKSKKEKRRSLPGGFPDEFDGLDQGDPPDRGRGDYPFVDNDVSSVVSVPLRDRSEKRKSRSRLDDLDDDAKSIASAPGGSRKRDSKSEKDKEKRNSTGSGFFDRFKSSIGIADDKTSRDEDKKSLKDNADTLGASVGLLGAAAALVMSQMSPINATDVPSEEKEALSDHITPSRQRSPNLVQRRPYDGIDPEIVAREIRPAIDPQYGDFLPLPPSPPPGPETTHETDELPALPDSRPETPEQERQLRREMLNRPPSHIRRKSANETPTKMKSPSQSAIPLRFGIGKGKRLSEPPSPVMRRVTPVSSPIATPTETLSAGKARPARPTSWDSTREFKPLYLVEKTSRDSIVPSPEHTDDPPQIPESASSSRASLDPKTDAQYEHAPSHDGTLGLNIPVTSVETNALQLGSQETTPIVRDLPDPLATPQQLERQLEEPSLSSLPENEDQAASKTDSTDPMPTDLKNEVPSAENAGLGIVTEIPAESDAIVSVLDDGNLPVDDDKVEAGPSEFSDVTSKKSKKGKKGKKNKKALDWEPEPESATILANDVPATSASHAVLPKDGSPGLPQETEPQQEVRSDPQTPTFKSTIPLTEDITESDLGPEPESVYATPMDTEVAPSAGFTFPEPVDTERGIPLNAQESTETVTHSVTSEEPQTTISKEPSLPTKKGKKKKKGKKSLSWDPEPELQPEAGPAPHSEVANTSTADSAPSNDAIIFATESTPDNNEATSLATREVEDLQQPPVSNLPEDTPLSPALEPQRSNMLHSSIPLENQLTAGTSGLETANVEIPSPDHTPASMVTDPQAESRDTTNTSTVKAADNDTPQDVVAEPLQLDLAPSTDLDTSASLQDPLPTADPSNTAIDHSAQPPSPRSLEDLVLVAEDVPSVSEQGPAEPLNDSQPEIGGKKKKNKNKKDKKRQSVSWEPEAELPTEVTLPEDTGPSEPPSEALFPSNELPPSNQPEMEATADDLWSAPAKSGKKGKKGKKARQSEVFDDAGPLQESEPPSASLVINEESRDQPTGPDLGNQPSSSTNWADGVEESRPAVSEPEPSQAFETTETEPQAEFSVSRKKSKKDKKKNLASAQFDDDLGEASVDQSQNEMSTQEAAQDISAPLTPHSLPSSDAEREISEPAPEMEITDDPWPTSSKKSKKKKKGQLVQWDDVSPASEPPQEPHGSDAPNVELPVGTSDEHPEDAVSTQGPADIDTHLQPESEMAPDTVFDISEEQSRDISKEPEAVADLVQPESSQVLPESNVPIETPEDVTPASHAISQVEEVAPPSSQTEMTASEEEAGTRETPHSELLQPSFDHPSSTEPAIDPVAEQSSAATDAAVDESAKLEDSQPVLAEEEFPLMKKSEKDKKKKKRQSTIDDLLDSGTSTPKEEPIPDTAEPESLPQTTTQDESQPQELVADNKTLGTDEKAELADLPQDDEWASFSTKKSKKDEKKKKKGAQTIDPEPVPEELQPDQTHQPSSPGPTSAAEAFVPDSSVLLGESAPLQSVEAKHDQFQSEVPSTDATEPAFPSEHEHTKDVQETPIGVSQSPIHALDPTTESAIMTSEDLRQALPDVQPETDGEPVPSDPRVEAQDDDFAPAANKKGKKKKKRQSLTQDPESPRTPSFDDMMRDWQADESQATPAPEELPSTSMEQTANTQSDQPAESLGETLQGQEEIKGSHELSARSQFGPEQYFAAQPVSSVADSHAIDTETPILPDQSQVPSHQHEVPSELLEQPISVALPDQETNSQQLSNPELIADIKNITDQAGDETGLPAIIQVGETVAESTPEICTEDVTDRNMAQDEPSFIQPAEYPEEPEKSVPDSHPIAETIPTEAGEDDYIFMAPKSKKDKKKKKRGQNTQEDMMTSLAVDLPSTTTTNQEQKSEIARDLADEPSKESAEPQIEDAAAVTPVIEDESPLVAEPESELATVKKSKKDKKKKKQNVSWTEDLPQDPVEAPQAEAAADVVASAEEPSSDLPVPAEEPAADTLVQAEEPSSDLTVPVEQPVTESFDRAEDLKEDDFTGVSNRKKSKKDKKKQKQLASFGDEEVQQELQQEQAQPFDYPVEAELADGSAQVESAPSHQEPTEAETSTPLVSAQDDEPFEFVSAKKSKKDKKKKKDLVSWDIEEPHEAQVLPEQSRDIENIDAGPSHDVDVAPVDSPIMPVDTKDDEFSGFTSSKESKKDKKKKRANVWETEPETQPEVLATTSHDNPLDLAAETPLPDDSPAKSGDDPTLEEHTAEASQDQDIAATQLEDPSSAQDIPNADRELPSSVPEDRLSKRDQFDNSEAVQEPSHNQLDVGQAIPSISIEGPHDSEQHLEQKQIDEQQAEAGADEQASTEPSTVFATPLGALTPAVQDESRDIAEASQASPAAQEVPDAEADLFVTKKSKKDKKKKKQASQTRDSESVPSTPIIDESAPVDQSTQATTQPTEDQTLLGSQEGVPEEAFPEFSTSKKSKKDKKKKTKASQFQEWEAETELEPESAFMTPLEEPDNQMERQLSTAPADLSSVNDKLAGADPFSSALPTSASPAETMPAEKFPAPPESQVAFAEIASGKKSKKDKKKKRASQLQNWDVDSSPASPAQEDPAICAATDLDTSEGDLVSQEALVQETSADPGGPEASEDVFSEFTTSKKSKKDKKKTKTREALLTPDAQEPDSFYTPFEESQQELGASQYIQAPEPSAEPAITEPTTETAAEPAAETHMESLTEPNAETTTTEPAATDPAIVEPTIAELGMTEPITEPTIEPTAKLPTTEPAVTESATSGPIIAEPAAEPVADDLSASKDVQPDDEFPEFISTKKSKKDKKKQKAAQGLLDWEDPVTSAPEVQTWPAQEIVSEAPVTDVPVEDSKTSEHPDMGKAIQAEEEFPEFVSTKKSKKDKKKAKAAVLAAMTDFEHESSTSDPPKVEEDPSLPAEPDSVQTPEIQDIANPSLVEPVHWELKSSEPRVEPAREHKASDPLSGPSLEPVVESHEAMITDSTRAEPITGEDKTMVIPDDIDKTVQDRELLQDQNIATDLPVTTPADVVVGQPEDASNEFPEFSVKKSKKDKKKAKNAKAAEASPWEEDNPAASGQASPFEQVPSQLEEQELPLPASETEDARVSEMLHDPSTLDTQPLTEVPEDVTGSPPPVDITAEASTAPEPSAFEEAEVDEFPIIRKKSKKDKKKQKAAALLASEPPSGTQTSAAQEDTAAGFEVSESLPVAEVQESTTREAIEDLPVQEPLQLDIGGKLVSEEHAPAQEATEDWPEFSSKKSKKDKKKSKSLVSAETELTPGVPRSSAGEAHSSRDLVDIPDVPDVPANDVSFTEQPIVEEPLQAVPADDDWPQYSTNKSKKDKKKRKATGILESEPASGAQTPLTQDMPVEESFTPAVPVPEQPAEEANFIAPTNMPEPPVPVEDDEWANFTSKKSKKDKKGKKKAKSSGSATPAEASVPTAEAPREFLSEKPVNIDPESSKAKDVWDDDSFFQPRASMPSPDQNAGLGRSMNLEGAVPETPTAPIASASWPAGEIDLSPAQLTSHVDHDKPFDQTTQRGKKVRTNTFLGDMEIPEPISAIEPDLVTVESDDFASRDLIEAPSEQPEVQAVPETIMEEAPSQPDRALSPYPTAREFAADYLNPGLGKHSERQNDKAASEWTPEFSTPLPQTTSERDIAVSYLESHSHKTGDAGFETGHEQRKNEPLAVAPQQETTAYHVGSRSAIGEDSSRGVIVAEYPPKIDQPSPEIKDVFSTQQPFHSRNADFAEIQTKSKSVSKSIMSKDEVEKDEGANDEETLAAAAALTGGVAMLANKFGGAKKAKVKKGKKSKYVDKRQLKEDDIFDDPMLWESEERKMVTGNDGGRLDTDTGDFWDVPDEAEEIQEDHPEKSMPKEIEMEGMKTLEGGARDTTHGIIASSSELPESPIVGRDENSTRDQPEMPTVEAPSGHLEAPSAQASPLDLIQDMDELDTTKPIYSRDADASPTHAMRTQMMSPSREFGDWARSSIMSARSLPPVEEEPSEEDAEESRKPRFGNVLHTPEMNRDSGFVAESPLRPSLFDDDSGNRDSGVHMKDWPEDGAKKHGGSSPSREITETASRDVKTPKREEKRARKSQLGEETPQLSTPDRSLGETSPDPEKKSRSHAAETTKTPRSARYGNLESGAGPALTPHGPGQQRSFSDKMTSRESSREEAATTTTPRSAPRSTSNTGMSRLRTPEPLNLRPESPGSVRSSGTSTPPLRRVDKRMSGDLRSLSQHNGSASSVHSALESPHPRLASPVPFPYPRPSSALSSSTHTPVPVPAPSTSSPASATARATKSSGDKDAQLAALQAERRRQAAAAAAASSTSSSSTPVANEGRVRARDMTDVYDGVGEGRIGSPRSPTRPHSMRRRQSMQVLELESKVEQLMAENRVLAEARHQADNNSNQRAVVTLNERDTLIEQLRSSLEEYKREVQRLKEVNEGLQSANSQLASQHSERYSHLQVQHASASSTLQDKDAEIQQLRDELEATKQQVRAMQEQILATKPADADFLRLKDEDYFDHRCQQLCAHVQQWVLRFSKFSDMRASRLTSEINDVKIVDRLDNTVLDGSDVDDYLSDRVRRRDVFMSMTMHMVWEYVFTRYLFGMDREQRQKLKTLEKLLSDVGPPHAVRQWRAVTLTLLARRPAFGDQRNDDTEAVVQAILETLSKILPPPTNMENQIQSQLRRVLREAVDLSIEMRTQRAEYMMLPPLQPEYDANGDLAETVAFNAALMNERSGGSTSNEDLEATAAVVRMVLFPLVIKKGDDNGLGDEEIVVCPAQVLVAKSSSRPTRMVTPSSEFGGAPLSRGATPSVGFKSAISLPMSPASEGADSHMEGAI